MAVTTFGLKRPPRLPVAIVVILAVTALVSLLYLNGERRRPVEIIGATVFGEVLLVEVRSCGGEPEVTIVEEDSIEVRIAVRASIRRIGSGNECADTVESRLASPLGDRTLVDLTSGRAVEVHGR